MYTLTELLDELKEIEFRTHPHSNLIGLGVAATIGVSTVAPTYAITKYTIETPDHVHEGQQRNTPPGQVRVAMAQGSSSATTVPAFITITPQYTDTPQPVIS